VTPRIFSGWKSLGIFLPSGCGSVAVPAGFAKVSLGCRVILKRFNAYRWLSWCEVGHSRCGYVADCLMGKFLLLSFWICMVRADWSVFRHVGKLSFSGLVGVGDERDVIYANDVYLSSSCLLVKMKTSKSERCRGFITTRMNASWINNYNDISLPSNCRSTGRHCCQKKRFACQLLMRLWWPILCINLYCTGYTYGVIYTMIIMCTQVWRSLLFFEAFLVSCLDKYSMQRRKEGWMDGWMDGKEDDGQFCFSPLFPEFQCSLGMTITPHRGLTEMMKFHWTMKKHDLLMLFYLNDEDVCRNACEEESTSLRGRRVGSLQYWVSHGSSLHKNPKYLLYWLYLLLGETNW